MEFDKKKTQLWISKMQQGNKEAYNEFYEDWYPKVFYIAFAIMYNEADAKDVAQDTMIHIHNSIKELHDFGYFKLWLNRIIISKCNRIFRKRKAPVTNENKLVRMHVQQENREYFEQGIQSDEMILVSMMQHLPPIYREVLALMYFEQLSVKEIFEILKISEKTLKSRISSARLKLKTEIEAYQEQEGIILNFQGLTMEAAITEAYFSFVQPEGMQFTITNYDQNIPIQHTNPKQTWLHNGIIANVAMIGLAGIVAVGSGMAVREYHNLNLKQALIEPTVAQPLSKSAFPEVQFRDIKVTDSKDAFYILMKYAHCEDELQELSEDERIAISNIKEELMKSEIYTDFYNTK